MVFRWWRNRLVLEQKGRDLQLRRKHPAIVCGNAQLRRCNREWIWFLLMAEFSDSGRSHPNFKKVMNVQMDRFRLRSEDHEIWLKQGENHNYLNESGLRLKNKFQEIFTWTAVVHLTLRRLGHEK
jgi:hypothetical protein